MKTIKEILKETRTIAVVGASANPEKASYRVAAYLKASGYRIFPVNPREKEVLGDVCYPDLSSVPEKIDVVDIFRRADDVLPVVEEAIRVGAKVIWMQLGIVNPQAAARAERAGMSVVMDACLMRKHKEVYCEERPPEW